MFLCGQKLADYKSVYNKKFKDLLHMAGTQAELYERQAAKKKGKTSKDPMESKEGGAEACNRWDNFRARAGGQVKYYEEPFEKRVFVVDVDEDKKITKESMDKLLLEFKCRPPWPLTG